MPTARKAPAEEPIVSLEADFVASGTLAGEPLRTMRITLNVVAVLLVLMGTIWFLQGVGVLPGSLMSGQLQWAIYGGVAVIVGASLAVVANRRR